MASLPANIQELLEDIGNSYIEDNERHGDLSRLRPALNQGEPRPEFIHNARQHPLTAYNQYPLPAVHAPRLPDDESPYFVEDADLDQHDQDLLAEPPPPPLWQSVNGADGSCAGRLSLPTCTTPRFPSTDPFGQPKTRLQQLIKYTPQTSRSQIDRHLHTPPAVVGASSPSSAPMSSPSYSAKQRQRYSAPRSRKKSINRYLPSRIDSDQKSQKPAVLPREASSSLPSVQQYQSSDQINLTHAPPIAQGIQLVSINELSDRCRSVFRHPLFNAIQSKCFMTAFNSDDNLVVSAPTGGGKTAILELAICRLVSRYKEDRYKIVYMAPTKSLCSERYRDWEPKFAALDLKCAELTGDTEHGQMRNVQGARIIITTPEKWDSMTRKWKDHAKLIQLIRLFLIDEVHILKDSRGATLEAVVSRMKSVGSQVRFVALSATVPNSEDIAAWLGKDPSNQRLPASREIFGEDFRPVKLQKHVIGLAYKGSDFGFEGVCDPKLPGIISRYSHKKPIMVFCITRKAALSTAKLLANVWAAKFPQDRQWEGSTQRLIVQDPELKGTLTSGVAFHHAGLDNSDRHVVEKGFLEGQINVICCTSTLAVGINLPCHMVIIKNTVTYTEDGIKEYSDLEIMQMLGRAGRPQFDSSAVAVIITKQEKVSKYEKLVSGEEVLESCLHLNLIDHLNAEIGLGTIYDMYTAKKWLAGTFLFVRLGHNPDHYKLDGNAIGQDLNNRIERVCKRDLALLEDSQLISASEDKLSSTDFGHVMARYYIDFKTMQIILSLQLQPKMSDILSAIVQAQEYNEVRYKVAEKKLLKSINEQSGIKFPIKVDIAMPAHKRSLILQAELGSVEYPTDEQFSKHKRQYIQDKACLFLHIHRITRCFIDCRIVLQDAVGVRNALELARSFSARVWDNSPYQLKQIAQIGLVAIRKLAIGGINNLEALEAAEPCRIEMLMSKNPPFGQKVLNDLKDFPKLRVSVKMVAKECQQGKPVMIKFKVQCGFLNERAPSTYHRKPVYVSLLTERSDGHLVNFKRISAVHLGHGKEFLLSAELYNHTQNIICHIMCESIAGTLRHAELRHGLPANSFSSLSSIDESQQLHRDRRSIRQEIFRKDHDKSSTSPATLEDDEFSGGDIDDLDMVAAATGTNFGHINEYEKRAKGPSDVLVTNNKGRKDPMQTAGNPERLSNGKYACNHKCKDKSSCKHMCCREGIDKAPKTSRKASTAAAAPRASQISENASRSAPQAGFGKQFPEKYFPHIEAIDLSDVQSISRDAERGSRAPRKQGIGTDKLPTQVSTTSYDRALQSDFGVRHDVDRDNQNWAERVSPPPISSRGYRTEISDTMDVGGCLDNDLPSPSTLVCQKNASDLYGSDLDPFEDFGRTEANERQEDSDSDLEAAMIGLGDSIDMGEATTPPRPAVAPTLIHKRAVKPISMETERRSGTYVCLDPKGSGNKEGDARKSLDEQRPSLPNKRKGASQVGQEVAKETIQPNYYLSSGLFSTSSPKKQNEQQGNPEAIANVQDGAGSSVVPLAKKQKLDHRSSGSQEQSEGKKEIEKAPPTIRAGCPAWVYDLDPGFVAEYQDFVNFVE